MDNLNRVLSFILGLVVVIVFFAVVTGRINLKKSFPFISKSASPSPTPSSSFSPTPISTVRIDNNNAFSPTNNLYQKTTAKTPTSIPSTGLPTPALFFLTAFLGGGYYLRTSKPRNSQDV